MYFYWSACLCYCTAFADSLSHRMGADSTHTMMTLGQLSLTLFMFPHSRVKSPIATNEGLSTDICDGHPFHLSFFSLLFFILFLFTPLSLLYSFSRPLLLVRFAQTLFNRLAINFYFYTNLPRSFMILIFYVFKYIINRLNELPNPNSLNKYLFYCLIN